MGNSGQSAACVGYLRAWDLCSQSYFHAIFKGRGYVSCELLLFFKKQNCTVTSLHFSKWLSDPFSLKLLWFPSKNRAGREKSPCSLLMAGSTSASVRKGLRDCCGWQKKAWKETVSKH